MQASCLDLLGSVRRLEAGPRILHTLAGSAQRQLGVVQALEGPVPGGGVPRDAVTERVPLGPSLLRGGLRPVHRLLRRLHLSLRLGEVVGAGAGRRRTGLHKNRKR